LTDGSITATFSGGTSPYTARIDGGPYLPVTSPKLYSGLGSGSHTVDVKDANDCAATGSLTIIEPPALTLSLGKTDVSCHDLTDGTVTATFGGGTGQLQIKIDGGSFADASSPKTFTGLGGGLHTVTVRDANLCSITREITVGNPPALTLSLGKTDVSCHDLSDGTVTA